MNKQLSIYLDALRFIAAMGVFASHFIMPRWTGGVLPEKLLGLVQQVGIDFVMVFFVLSGFVIAYTVDVKDRVWRDYAFSRSTRMYSVAAPAILATYLLDRSGIALNAGAYDGWWYADESLLAMFWRGLTFSNEFWFSGFRPGSNGPYWSLGYEVWYYILFGIVFFMRGFARIFAAAIACALVGPRILLLAPVWVIGAMLYYALRDGRLGEAKSKAAQALVGTAVLAPPVLFAAFHYFDLNNALYAVSARLVEPIYDAGLYERADRFLWHWLVGVLVTVHLAGVAVMLKSWTFTVPMRLEKAIRWLAGGSFSIYLIHYPAMQFTDAVLTGPQDNPYRAAILGLSSLAICFLFASVFERRLASLRSALRSLAQIGRQPRGSLDPAE